MSTHCPVDVLPACNHGRSCPRHEIELVILIVISSGWSILRLCCRPRCLKALALYLQIAMLRTKGSRLGFRGPLNPRVLGIRPAHGGLAHTMGRHEQRARERRHDKRPGLVWVVAAVRIRAEVVQLLKLVDEVLQAWHVLGCWRQVHAVAGLLVRSFTVAVPVSKTLSDGWLNRW